MGKFVTIKTFSNPMELAVIRGRLEADGIECLVLDELTTQINPAYTNASAYGGIRLQVRESDVQEAIDILKDSGYIDEEDLKPSETLLKLNKATSKIPLLRKLRFELRLMILLVLILGIIATVIYFATLPSTFSRLTKHKWCVHKITYNGEDYVPNTVALFKISMNGFCQENLDIETDGTITLPGFNSRHVQGKWLLDGKLFRITQTDTFDFVYNGVYDIEFPDNLLILKSEQTAIYCYPQELHSVQIF